MYEYDFGDSWIHDLRIETILPVNPRKHYPVCVAGKRAAPPEDCGGPYAFMMIRRHDAGFGHGRSRDELDGLVDDIDDDEEWDIVSDNRPDKFDRRKINRALGKLASGLYGEALDEIHNPGVDRIPQTRCHSASRSRRLTARVTGARTWVYG